MPRATWLVMRMRVATDIDGLGFGDLLPGARIGDYHIVEQLHARGGGVVYSATHAFLPRRVSMRLLPPIHSWTRGAALQLLREACIVEAIDHPGVARIYESGMLPDRRPWIASEHVDGFTLATHLEMRALPAVQVAMLIANIAEVLEHAHRRGVVHGNLSMQAIVVANPGRRFPICVGEWMAARTLDAARSTPPLPSLAAGPYLAPEQRAGGAVDGRSDVYALGVIAHQALHGELPDAAQSTRCTNGAPPMLVALIRKMMASDPDRRPTSSQLRVAIASVLAELARPVAPPVRAFVQIHSDQVPMIAGEIS